MIVEGQIPIKANRAAIWAAITNIEQLGESISGIEKIEVLERPVQGLVGLRWRETRMLRDKSTTVEKRITHATEGESYTTRAESDGFAFVTTKKISGNGADLTLTETHEFNPQGTVGKILSVLMGIFFKGVIRKAILQDLYDIKVAIEPSAPA